MENALYLEWFTSHHDMVLLESTVFSIKVSLPEWMMDSCEEQAQIMANQQMLRTQVKNGPEPIPTTRRTAACPITTGTNACGRRKPSP
ncbi:MAG: hypothetical protein ACLSUW_03605 [Akkermansia sp.]